MFNDQYNPHVGLRHFTDKEFISHPSHAEMGFCPFPDKLYVITSFFNPLRYHNRIRNYWKFHHHMECSGAQLYTVEIALGDRPFEVTDKHNSHNLQLRTHNEMWHKENAINLMINRLPDDAKYIAWIDCDVQFFRPDWVQETMHLLQHYDFLQLFSHAQDMNHHFEPMDHQYHLGFMKGYIDKLSNPLQDWDTVADDEDADAYYPSERSGRPASAYWHPGYAWAARREALEDVGLLIDWAILGSADWHMAWGLIGQMNKHIVPELSDNYKAWCMEWEARAEQNIKRNVGYMEGLLLHHYHGEKNKRVYGNRWKFLIDAGFDPVKDIKRDAHGLWKLSGNNPRLRDGIRTYARMRCEDEYY